MKRGFLDIDLGGVTYTVDLYYEPRDGHSSSIVDIVAISPEKKLTESDRFAIWDRADVLHEAGRHRD